MHEWQCPQPSISGASSLCLASHVSAYSLVWGNDLAVLQMGEDEPDLGSESDVQCDNVPDVNRVCTLRERWPTFVPLERPPVN